MAGGAAAVKAMTSDEAWPILKESVIDKLIHNLDAGVKGSQIFTSDEYMRFYTLIYDVSSPNPIGPEVQKLYDHYKRTFDDYIYSTVLPALREKEDEELLQELLRRWRNHLTMTRWLSRFFFYINRYFVPHYQLPSLVTTSHLAFYDLVYSEIKARVRDMLATLVDREREGEQIDQTLVKEILDIYVEIGEDSLKYYTKDFEEGMLIATTKFYATKSSDWIASMSCEDYMVKVEECLKQEKNRVSNYLRFISKNKLLEVVEYELLTVHSGKLAELKEGLRKEEKIHEE